MGKSMIYQGLDGDLGPILPTMRWEDLHLLWFVWKLTPLLGRYESSLCLTEIDSYLYRSFVRWSSHWVQMQIFSSGGMMLYGGLWSECMNMSGFTLLFSGMILSSFASWTWGVAIGSVWTSTTAKQCRGYSSPWWWDQDCMRGWGWCRGWGIEKHKVWPSVMNILWVESEACQRVWWGIESGR